MGETILKNIRDTKKISVEKISDSLGIEITEYLAIENGEVELTYKQAGILGELYGIDPKHLLTTSDSVNYNLGTYSRTIYTTNYYEGDEKER